MMIEPSLEQDIEIIKNQLSHISNILEQTVKHGQLVNFDVSTFSHYNYSIEYLKKCKNT